MKTRTLISLICSLTINSFYTLNQPAAAEQLPSTPTANALKTASPDADDTNNLAAILVGKKYGYKDSAGKMAIAPRFDAAYEFFDGIHGVPTLSILEIAI